MPTYWNDITAVTERQLGLITTGQLDEAGCGPKAKERMVERGYLLVHRHGVLRIAGAPVTPHMELLAACLAAGPFVAASFWSAGWLHILPGTAPGAAEITTFGDLAARLDGVKCHRSDFVDPTDFTSIAGIPTTSLVRTIIDLAGVVHPTLLGKMLDEVMPWRATADAIDLGLERLGGRRRGCRMLRLLVAERRGGEGGLEAKWLKRLADAGVVPPEVHYVVVVLGRVYELDFAWPLLKVAIEVMGFDPRKQRSKFDAERRRNNRLRGQGWIIIEVTSNTPLHEVLEELHRALQSRSR